MAAEVDSFFAISPSNFVSLLAHLHKTLRPAVAREVSFLNELSTLALH